MRLALASLIVIPLLLCGVAWMAQSTTKVFVTRIAP